MATEKRLIDANAFTAHIEKQYCKPCKERGQDYNEIRCRACWVDDMGLELDAQPTVDAVEVVHARWSPIRNFGGGECYGYCTNCKTPVKADNATGLVMSNRFCHWCGAMMDLMDEDGDSNG